MKSKGTKDQVKTYQSLSYILIHCQGLKFLTYYGNKIKTNINMQYSLLLRLNWQNGCLQYWVPLPGFNSQLDQWKMACAWRNLYNIPSRPLFTIIFRPDILKCSPIFHFDRINLHNGFVIYCVLKQEKFKKIAQIQSHPLHLE